MQRRKFSREFKLEAVRLIKDRGVAVAQAARDLDLHENVLRKWVRDLSADPQHAFPGHGQMKPEQLEIDRLRKEVAKLKAERDILKNRPRAAARCPSSEHSRRPGLGLEERRPRLGFDVMRRACGAASVDVRWSVV